MEAAADVVECRRLGVGVGGQHGLAGVGAEGLVVPVVAGHAEHRHLELAPAGELVERREELALGEVAGRTEEHQRVGGSCGHAPMLADRSRAVATPALACLARCDLSPRSSTASGPATSGSRARLDSLDDDTVARPSLLPGWTVGHVLTHIAAQRRQPRAGAARCRCGARSSTRYPGGSAQRDAEIEQGSGRPVDELVADVRATSARLEATWDGTDRRGLGRARHLRWAAGAGRLAALRPLAGGGGAPRRPRPRLHERRLAGRLRPARPGRQGAWRGGPACRWA